MMTRNVHSALCARIYLLYKVPSNEKRLSTVGGSFLLLFADIYLCHVERPATSSSADPCDANDG